MTYLLLFFYKFDALQRCIRAYSHAVPEHIHQLYGLRNIDSENHQKYMEGHGAHLISTIMTGAIRTAESMTVDYVMVTVRRSFHMKILIHIQLCTYMRNVLAFKSI